MNGVSSYGNSSNTMLVVVDGIITNEFPADFTVSQIESVEVLTNPDQTLKYCDELN